MSRVSTVVFDSVTSDFISSPWFAPAAIWEMNPVNWYSGLAALIASVFDLRKAIANFKLREGMPVGCAESRLVEFRCSTHHRGVQLLGRHRDLESFAVVRLIDCV